jgi:hypothetical protein
MYTLTVRDGDKIFGAVHFQGKVLSITSSLRYNLKPLTVWSVFGCARNVARVLVVSINSDIWRDYEFHVPEKSAEVCIENLMQQIDDIFFFDLPPLVPMPEKNEKICTPDICPCENMSDSESTSSHE